MRCADRLDAHERVPPHHGRTARQRSPRRGDLKRLSPEQLTLLAAEIRDFLVAKVSRTGGHLGPNLGVVEMTLALHRVFDSPRDRILFDTGHQAYVHKIVTGRQGGFDLLRQRGGLSGYPSQAESEHDLIENSHASTALSYADGMSKAFTLRGEDRHVVAVVGDGALTGGMCWEALNNIAAAKNRLVIVVNDNGRSYAPTIGGLADHLSTLRLNPGYEKVLDLVKEALGSTPMVGKPMYEVLHAVKRGIKDAVSPQPMFEDLGLKYVGPVDGHDLQAMESALRRAKGFNAPGDRARGDPQGLRLPPGRGRRGGLPARPGGAFELETGKLLAAAVGEVDARLRRGAGRDRRRAPGRRRASPPRWPSRPASPRWPGSTRSGCTTSASPSSTRPPPRPAWRMGGLHPVVAVYATFLNRAFDQVLLDVAMHGLPVTFVLDRAGITGPDGPSHYGIWDMSVFGVVPGLRIAAPRDAATLREELREAVAVEDGPTIVRFPTGSVAADLPALRRVGQVDVLREDDRKDVLLVAVGAFGKLGMEVAERIAEQGYGVTVVDPRWVRPVPIELAGLAAQHRLVVTLEDGVRAGGVGDAIASDAARRRRAGAAAGLRRAGRLPPARHPGRDPGRAGPHRPGRRPRRHRVGVAPRGSGHGTPVHVLK